MIARVLALAALALVGCGPAYDPSTPIVLSPATEEMHQLLIEADLRWENSGVDPDRVTVSDVGGPGLPVWTVPRAEVGARCGATGAEACVDHDSSDAPTGIYMADDSARVPAVLTHELGHLISGEEGNVTAHLQESEGCPVDAKGVPQRGEHLMCRGGTNNPVITPLDTTFICGFEYSQCVTPAE